VTTSQTFAKIFFNIRKISRIAFGLKIGVVTCKKTFVKLF